jgi:DNA-binding CsgD family transcriptional regulator
LEALAAAARGERSQEIAARLSFSERRVKAYLESVYAKLGVVQFLSDLSERRGPLYGKT